MERQIFLMRLGRWVSARAVAAILVSGTTLSAWAQNQETLAHQCVALVDVKNDLFLANSNGDLAFRFTHDGRGKQSVALAPDGRKIAFIPDSNQESFAVADVKGRSEFFPVTLLRGRKNVGGPFIGIRFESNDLLSIKSHVGLNADQFDFYRIPEHLSSRLRPVADSSFGGDCSVAPHGDDVACVQGGDVLVNGKIVFSATGFTGADPKEALMVSVGSTVMTRGSPSFKVQVLSLDEGVPIVRVTLPNGNWKEARTAKGGMLSVNFDEHRFGFAITQVNRKTSTVNVDVLESPFVDQVFSAVAWKSKEDLAVAQVSDGEPALLVLHRKDHQHCGRHSRDEDEDRHKARWVLVGQAKLNISEPIDRMLFVKKSNIAFETSQRFGELLVDVIEDSSGMTALQLGAITERPRMLSVNSPEGPVAAAVFGWSCK